MVNGKCSLNSVLSNFDISRSYKIKEINSIVSGYLQNKSKKTCKIKSSLYNDSQINKLIDFLNKQGKNPRGSSEIYTYLRVYILLRLSWVFLFFLF